LAQAIWLKKTPSLSVSLAERPSRSRVRARRGLTRRGRADGAMAGNSTNPDITGEDVAMEADEDPTLFHDPDLDGLDLNDRHWAIVQKGLKQVSDFCEDVGLPQYYEEFLKAGFIFGNMLRTLTPYVLTNKIKMTDPDEQQACLDRAVELVHDPNIVWFERRYGNPGQFFLDTWQGKQFRDEHPDWFEQKEEVKDEVATLQGNDETWADKWGIKPEDFDLFSMDPTRDWATVGCLGGMTLLWPIDHPAYSPPCIRCAYCHPNDTTDYVIDWERMMTISCGGDCRVVLYDLENAKITSTIKNNGGIEVAQSFLCIDGSFDAGKVSIGAANGLIKIGDMERGSIVTVLKGHLDDVQAVRTDWDRNQVCSVSWDFNLHIYDLRSGKRSKCLSGHTYFINDMEVDFERQLAISCASQDMRMATLKTGMVSDDIYLWDLAAGAPVKSWYGHFTGTNCTDTNWEKMITVTGGEDHKIKIWDIESGECTKEWYGKHIQTLALSVNWEKKLLLTGSWDYRVKLWHLETGNLLKELFKARRTVIQAYIKGCNRGLRL